jgi:hypothetical protein
MDSFARPMFHYLNQCFFIFMRSYHILMVDYELIEEGLNLNYNQISFCMNLLNVYIRCLGFQTLEIKIKSNVIFFISLLFGYSFHLLIQLIFFHPKPFELLCFVNKSSMYKPHTLTYMIWVDYFPFIPLLHNSLHIKTLLPHFVITHWDLTTAHLIPKLSHTRT